MGRNILFVTTDEQRYDALGCYGGRIARTPVADRLAAEGVLYERAYAQNVTCMPARSTIVTGRHVNTHGVFRNGYSLPEADPSIAALLHEQAGYRTALVGKAHWQPMVDPAAFEATAATAGRHGPYRGFDHLSLAVHSAHSYRCVTHYSRWMADNHGEQVECFYPPVGPKNGPNNLRGGETGAIQVHFNDCPREHYHTDWVADRALEWLGDARRRRRLVPLGELPRPASPLRSAALRARPDPLARARPAARPSGLARESGRAAVAEAQALARLLSRQGGHRRGNPGRFRAVDDDR